MVGKHKALVLVGPRWHRDPRSWAHPWRAWTHLHQLLVVVRDKEEPKFKILRGVPARRDWCCG